MRIQDLVKGGPQVLRPKVADVAKWSRVSEASNLRPGSRAHLRALEAFGFLMLKYVSLRLHVRNAVPAQPCVGKLGISLVLLNFLHCNFRLWFKTPQTFNSYPCRASVMTRNTLNHCLKFTLCSIFCHICYGKISEKNVNTLIKVKLLVSKTSDSCFQGFDFFQMLLASHS